MKSACIEFARQIRYYIQRRRGHDTLFEVPRELYKLMMYLPIKLNSSIFELTLILWFSENIREIDAESKVKWQ